MTKKTLFSKIWSALFDNKVVLFFVVLSGLAIWASGQPLSFVVRELFTRFGRNGFVVLSLIIPVVTGMGLNFGIVIGAMSAQVALIFTTHWDLVGIGGFLITIALATPIATILGMLVGLLFNRMKGSEMIGGMVLSYFAEGFYQFFFLFVIGGWIPIVNQKLIISGGIGVLNTVDLTKTIKYALDDVTMQSLLYVLFVAVILVTVLTIIVKRIHKEPIDVFAAIRRIVWVAVLVGISFIPEIGAWMGQKRIPMVELIKYGGLALIVYFVIDGFINLFVAKKEGYRWQKLLKNVIIAVILVGLTYVPTFAEIVQTTNVPVTTYGVIAGLWFFNNALLKTKLGQNMRTVGQNRVVANAAGINVNRTRIIAMIFSTVLASWGQLIYLQNIGTWSTYGSHVQIGLFSIAALLVGGASVQKATSNQAILGILLFHSLFIVAPLAGNTLFGNAMIGEYFRVFISYGVIAVALAMHAWKQSIKPQLRRGMPDVKPLTANSSTALKK